MTAEDFERLLAVLEGQQEILKQQADLMERQAATIARLAGVEPLEAEEPAEEDRQPCRILPLARRSRRTRGSAP